MSRLRLSDRLPTIAVTATLTSCLWLIYFAAQGSTLTWSDRGGILVRQSEPRTTPSARDRSVPGLIVSAGPLIIPVRGVAPAGLTDSFVDGRGGGDHLHEAIDIMAPAGTPVMAAAAGKVEKLFQSQDGGLTIYVRSPDRRTIYYYAHLLNYAPGLAEGQDVAPGSELGAVGSSGNASEEAPHLHFAVLRTDPAAQWWEPASAINPYPLLSAN